MKNVTLLFPGQGAQYVGMGKDLIDHPKAKEIFSEASNALDFDITQLMFEGPEEKLTLTEFTQPAIVTHSVALFEVLREKLIERDINIKQVLGHSVGEYSALVAAGSLKLEDALKAVNKRGQFMQSATPEGVGAMYAMLRVPSEKIDEACAAASTETEKVMCANYNEPTQTVISGHAPACERAIKWLEENYEGRMRAMPLKVSAPFHSSLMLPAQENLATYLSDIQIQENQVDYIANINAKRIPKGTSGDQIKNNLIEQVSGSVLWSQSISSLSEDKTYIEVGPGKVLAGLNKKINKELATFSTDTNLETLTEFLDANDL